MMSRMLLSSSSCVLVFLLFVSHDQCNGRHLSTIDDHKAKLLSHDSTIKGFGNDLFTVHDDLNLKRDANVKDLTTTFDNEHYKRTDSGSKNKKVKKFKELVHGRKRQHHDHHKSTTFKVPPKNKHVHQQPGFNLDYSPPKTHPPSHN